MGRFRSIRSSQSYYCSSRCSIGGGSSGDSSSCSSSSVLSQHLHSAFGVDSWAHRRAVNLVVSCLLLLLLLLLHLAVCESWGDATAAEDDDSLHKKRMGLFRWHEPAPDHEWHAHVDRHWDGQHHVRNHRGMRERFDEVYHRVRIHNEEYAQGKHSFYLSHDMRHASMLEDQLKNFSFGLKPTRLSAFAATSSRTLTPTYASFAVSSSPSVDWARAGRVQDVKDQGACGSCWAFSTTSAIETAIAIAQNGTGPVPNLSEQQLVDCEIPDSLFDGSCTGGNPSNAISYVIEHGLTVQPKYPYVSGDTGKQNPFCNLTAVAFKSAAVTRLELVPPQNEGALISALNGQSVIVFLEASSFNFLFYKGGIFNDPRCGLNLDHAVVAVGYGTNSSGVPFWKIRNHWTQFWGEGGYMRIQRTGGAGTCGITFISSMFPIVSAPSTDPCATKPCGAGRCTAPNPPAYTCACPTGFVSTGGNSPTCAIQDYCKSQAINPCGAGTCSNNGKGFYTCTCTNGYVLGNDAQGKPTCVTSGDGGGLRTYTVKEGDFCFKVWVQFGLRSASFFALNPAVDCSKLVTGQILTVGTSVGNAVCTQWYTIKLGDYCDQIASSNQLTRTQLQSLNPNLKCNALFTGSQICVKGNTVASTNPRRCGRSYTLQGNETCSWLLKTFALNSTQFQTINPGVNCTKLPPKGTQICVAQFSFGTTPVPCGNFDYIREGDSCWALRTLYGLTERLFLSLNPGILCTSLQIGQRVCLSP